MLNKLFHRLYVVASLQYLAILRETLVAVEASKADILAVDRTIKIITRVENEEKMETPPVG